MDIFSEFCNICCKYDNKQLQNICDGNMDHLKDILITFIGHEDIIHDNSIYLCELCCQKLVQCNQFKGMCFTNLIQLRQLCLSKISKLDMAEDASTIQNILEEFLHEDVLRNILYREKNVTDTISTNPQVIIVECSDMTGTETQSQNEIKNLTSDRREFEFDTNCSDKSQRNDNDCKNFEVEYVKQEIHMNNPMQTFGTDSFEVKHFESESDERGKFDIHASNINNSNESGNFQTEFKHEEVHIKQENNTSEDLESDNIEYEFIENAHGAFQIPTCTIVKIENCEDTGIRSAEDANSNLSAGGTSNQQLHPYVLEHWTNEYPTAQSSDANDHADSSAEVHTCTVCNKTFNSSSRLWKHKHVHNAARPYKCTICTKAFRVSSDLIKHARVHSGNRAHKCTVCNMEFIQSFDLTRHKRIHNGERPFKCSVCNKAFTQFVNLTRHERIHSGDKPYLCPVCKKAFSDSSTLTKHERIHTHVKRYKCPLCDMEFIQSCDLTKHKRIHSADRQYICNVCNKVFKRPSRLALHQRIHTGDRPYKCTVCDKGFTQLCNLTRHERIHSDDKPYECSFCNKPFSVFGNLIRHQRIHTGDRPYKCTICNKGFIQSSDAINHERTHTGAKPYKCNGCNKTFTTSSLLAGHKRRRGDHSSA